MLRLVAYVTLSTGVDPTEPMARLRAMAATEPNVLSAEVGLCVPTREGGTPVATYAYTATFADRDAYERYATGAPHDEVAAAVAPVMESCQAALFSVEGGPTA